MNSPFASKVRRHLCESILNRRMPRRWALWGLFFCVATAGALRAQVWTGSFSTDWSNALNWSGGVPGNTATATFSSNTANDPNFTAATTVGRLNFASGTDSEAFTGSALTLNGVSGIGLDNQSGVGHTFNNTLVVAAAQTWNAASGGFDLSAVTLNANLTLTGSAAFDFGGAFLLNGANRTLTNNASGPVTLSTVTGGNRTLTVAGSGDTAITGAMTTGTGGVTKLGTGTLTLSGANTNTGATTIGSSGGTSGGTLRLGASNILANATTTVFGGTLDLDGFNETIGALTLGGGAAGTTATVTTGAGTLTLGGNVTYTATNNPEGAIISGRLSLGSANRTITVNDSLAAGLDLAINADIAATNRNLTVTGTGSSAITGDITTGTGTLTKSGTGTLTLSGNNTYSGATAVTAGVLNIQSGTALGATTAGTTISNNAALQLEGGITVGNETLTLTGTGVGATGALRSMAGDNTWSGNLVLTGNTRIGTDAGSLTILGGISGATRTLTVVGAGDTFLNGALTTTSGGLVKLGTGTLTLSGANTNTGATTIGSSGGTSGGTLRLGASNILANATTTIFGGTLDLDGFNETIGALTLGGGAAGTTAAVTTGTGTLTLGGNVTYTATNNPEGAIISGQLNLGSANRTITVNDSAAAGLDLAINASITATNRNLTVTGAGTSAITGAITTGTGALTKSGTGTLTLSGNNTYSGATTVSAGVLNIQSGTALGATTAGTTVASGATLQLEGGIAVGNEALTLSGTGVGGTGALRSVSGENTWGGNVALNANTQINADAGSLALAGGISGANRSLTFDGAGNISVGGAITTGTGALTKSGAGTLTLAGASTYTGATTVSAGTLLLGASEAISNSSAVTVASGATFDLNGQTETIASLAGAGQVLIGTGQLISAGNASTVFSGTLAGTGSFTKAGTGTLTLDNSFAFAGTFNLAGGTLQLSSTSLSLGTLNITGNATIDFAGDSTLSVANFSVAGGVTLTLTNWVNAADYFFAQNWTGAISDLRGLAPMNQVVFTGFAANDTVWQGYDNQVTPVPEPSTYGALLLLLLTGAGLLRRRRVAR